MVLRPSPQSAPYGSFASGGQTASVPQKRRAHRQRGKARFACSSRRCPAAGAPRGVLKVRATRIEGTTPSHDLESLLTQSNGHQFQPSGGGASRACAENCPSISEAKSSGHQSGANRSPGSLLTAVLSQSNLSNDSDFHSVAHLPYPLIKAGFQGTALSIQ